MVAVSGGADSVALLSLLLEVRTQFELELIVAHLNHNLRGKASDEDEEFVRVLAHRVGTRFISEKIPAADVKARLGGLENWAREQRYAFLLRAAGSVHSQKVALGHTMNDQAETFLMRLFRGSGSVGLSAMSSRRDTIHSAAPLNSTKGDSGVSETSRDPVARRRFKPRHPVPAQQGETRTHSESPGSLQSENRSAACRHSKHPARRKRSTAILGRRGV